MERVQVTGLPGTGKTTGIEIFLQEHNNNLVSYLDIRNFDSPNKDQKFWEAITTTPGSLIAESAVGVTSTNTWIIRLEPPLERVYKQCEKRDGSVDADYLSVLAGLMIPAHYILREPEELPRVLKELLIH